MAYSRKNIKKHKLPGTIALALFLPIIFVYYLFQIGLFDVQHCITLAVEDKYCEDGPWYFRFDPSGRKYSEFVINGNKKSDEESLKLAKKEIRNLIDSEDLHKGVHFYFTETSKYNEFIEVINICQTEKTDIFISRGNDFWVVNTRMSDENQSVNDLFRL